MSSYDSSDFVDADLQTARKSSFSGAATSAAGDYGRPPTREEIDSKVSDAQLKLAELKRAQEELERERASLEEARRRQIEFQTGREEMLHSLTRGLGLLEQAEFSARLEAEQMAKTVTEFQDALRKVQAIREDTWTKDNYAMELTRALTTIENARLEWNAARLKFPVLSGETAESATAAKQTPFTSALASQNYWQLCKIGLALTWPVAVAGLGIIVLLVFKK